MYNLLVDYTSQTSDPVMGLIGFLMGMAIVFLGIGILVLAVWLMGTIVKSVDARKKEKKPVEKESTTPVVQADDGEIPDAVKAAIVAAISVYYMEQGSNCEFKVRKIKRI